MNSRLKENEMVVNEMTKRAKDKSSGSYEEVVTFQLGIIATMLADISKSLAVIADKVEKDESKDLADLYALH